MMRKLFIIYFLLVLFIGCSELYGAELPEDTVYKHLGPHRTAKLNNIRLHFPQRLEPSIPRILENINEIYKRLVKHFPKQKNTSFDVILTNHDDCVDFSNDISLDILKLEVFEEIGVLSTRSYSLERRFALKLAHIMLLKEISAESNKLMRNLGQLAMPEWFITGLTLHYAFPIDTLQMSRLIDMARNGRIYNLRQLASVDSQPELIKEKMMFQTHSMIRYWDTTYGEGSGLKLLKNIVRHPAPFLEHFKRAYGVELYVAYNSYLNHMAKQAGKTTYIPSKKLKSEDGIEDSKYFRSYRHISDDTVVWVSSKRYSTETYDLFFKKGNNNPVLLLKNVHPVLFYDKYNNEIVLGKYLLNSIRQKRLGLWAVNLSTGKTRCLVDEPGSFKPLGKLNNRIYFTSIRNGQTRIMSVDPSVKGSEQVEYVFPSDIRPLDLCMNERCDKIYFVYETATLESNISVLQAINGGFEEDEKHIFVHKGQISSLVCYDNCLWFGCEKDYFMQLHKINPANSTLEQFEVLPGGVWDINFYDNKIELLTLHDGTFKRAFYNIDAEPVSKQKLEDNYELNESSIDEIKSVPYTSLYAKGFWVPNFLTDDEGFVLGIKTYQRDLLGRSEFSITPTYGFSSKNAGYLGLYSQRQGLFKFTLYANQQTTKRSYLSKDYFEKNIQQRLELEYPISLSTKLTAGFDMSERSIRKLKYDPNLYPVPTVGQDNSFFAKVDVKALRTEPYYEIFPRKGREVSALYQSGTNMFNGDMEYSRVHLRWDEYVPLSSNAVFAVKSYYGEDSKHGDLRRPEDLSLGGDDLNSFLKAYDATYKSGNRLRALSCNFGFPINFRFPRFMSWIYNEFASAEVFVEGGDVISSGHFNWVYDRGVEFKSKVLLLKRLPLKLTIGYAKRNGNSDDNSYFQIDYTAVSNIFH